MYWVLELKNNMDIEKKKIWHLIYDSKPSVAPHYL